MLNWVTQKYGKEKVAHIITYGTMATKLAIKDVARVQKLLLAESDRLCKLVPDRIPDKKLNLQNAIDYVPELKAAEQSDNPTLSDTIRYAKMLEGQRAQYGACMPAARSSAATTSPTGCLWRRPTTRRRAKRCW